MRRFDSSTLADSSPLRAHEKEPEEVVEPSRDEPVLRIVLPLRTITPVLGGGVKPWESDPLDAVRVPTIRGHLRWWWRALCPANLTADDLFEKEKSLWGGVTENGAARSKIVISIERIRNKGEILEARKLPKALRYATFPLDLHDGSTFRTELLFDMRLEVRGASHQDLQHIVDAVWLWIHLGGLGARTRRGFGALALADDPKLSDGSPTNGELHTTLHRCNDATFRACLHRIMRRSIRRPLSCSLIGNTYDIKDAASAHELLIGTLMKFRQGRRVGRSYRNKSNWPDGFTLRALRSVTPKALHGLPRAAFGLPLRFDFRHNPNHALANATIYPARGSVRGAERSHRLPWSYEVLRRFASPLLLSLSMTTDGIVPSIILLAGEQVDALRVEWEDGANPPASVPYYTITGSQDPIARYLRKASGNGLEAFRRWAVASNYWKVGP